MAICMAFAPSKYSAKEGAVMDFQAEQLDFVASLLVVSLIKEVTSE